MFKQLSANLTTKWYCKFCVGDTFPFGKLGKIAFSDITNNISMETIKMELVEFTAKF